MPFLLLDIHNAYQSLKPWKGLLLNGPALNVSGQPLCPPHADGMTCDKLLTVQWSEK